MIKKTDRGLRSSVITLEKLLFSTEKLCIPGYQRPYKWSVKNVNQLIDDILQNTHRSAYRLGTIVLHRKDGLNIVDGQQRLLTLSILAAELIESGFGLLPVTADDLALAGHQISDPVSLKNLRRNHAVIRFRIREFSEEQALFFFKNCEAVKIELTEISEAFQFFDGQNSRGLDLKPHDLLKAFHLREMNTEKKTVLNNSVTLWEANTSKLTDYFPNYFYKIKRWSQGRSGLGFSKDHIDTFKGIKTGNNALGYSYERGHLMVHQYSPGMPPGFPFQIDQPMINGRRFFQFVDYYSRHITEINSLRQSMAEPDSLLACIGQGNPLAGKILYVLNSYRGRRRQGDSYLRNLLDCCLLYYTDKFGRHKVDEALIRFFFWAYALRLEKGAVQEVTVDNLARQEDGFFRLIRDAVHPSEIIQREFRIVNYVGDKSAVADIEDLVQLFKDQHVIISNK